MSKKVKEKPEVPYSKQLFDNYTFYYEEHKNNYDPLVFSQHKQFEGIRGLNKGVISTTFSYAINRWQSKPSVDYNEDKEDKCRLVLKNLDAAVNAKEIFLLEKEGTKILRLPEKVTATTPKSVIPYPSFPEDDVKKMLSSESNTDIKLLDTWLPPFLDLEEGGGEKEKFLMKIFKNKDKKIKILLLDPMGKSFDIRFKANLKHDKSLFDLKKKAFNRIKNLYTVNKENKDSEKNKNLEIKLYDESPSINCLIGNKDIYMGYYLSFDYCTSTSYVKIENNKNYFAEDINNHFDCIWNKAIVFDDKSLEELEQKIEFENIAYLQCKDMVLKVFLPRNTFFKDNEGNHSPLNDMYEGIHNQDSSDLVIYTLKIKSDTDSSQNAKWTLDEHNTIDGSFQAIHRNYFRCQLNFKNFTLSLVIPIDINKPNEPKWIIYSIINNNKSYCGTTLAVSMPKKSDNLQLFGDKEWLVKIKHSIVTRSKDFWSPVDIYKQTDQHASKLSLFKGIYKTYSYGRHERKDVMVLNNILEIDDLGRVKYFREKGKIEALGFAFLEGDNLYINLKSITKKRRCQFVFYAKDKYPEVGRYYSGIYVGLSQDFQYPLGLRIVAEYIPNKESDDLKPTRNVLNSESFKQLPNALKASLIGRLENFISFPRNSGSIFSEKTLQSEADKNNQNNSLCELLYKAACFDAQSSNIEKAIHGIKRAYNHGFTDFEGFEEFLKNLDNKIAHSKITDHSEYKKIKQLYDKYRSK